ncbi:MAG: carbamoyl-phosphate synthase large subunit [Chloroflexi bacterium]|nr:carbamoyl-phosphate synthase large subunit [Chloroflexota bacterium]
MSENSSRPRKVLVIGSGPIVIGQAAEFDYAGTQACRALREEGVETVLVNSNPATIMTDSGVADTTYIEPLTVEMLENIVRRERPDGVLATLGGQTGLNLAVDAAEAGVFERYGAHLIGTRLESIKMAEDRELFKQMLLRIGEPIPTSRAAETVDEALEFARDNGYPVIVRPAFTLGGTGGGQARDEDELRRVAASGLAASPVTQVLVEQSLIGWKELEYEVLRDAADTCIVVCNMENIDPMGVHTGDSIVVAPSQTLSDREYQMLRTAAIKIIRALDIRGGCNVQFALDPQSRQYYVIEVNPRVSRSSALASKATGYPIARVSAKIAIGKRLDEIPNAVTQRTTAAFEPALDYLVVKVPRWPFDKFGTGDRTIGTQMKATGEVMAIDRSFEAALQKAFRSLEFRGRNLLWEDRAWAGPHGLDVLWPLIETPNDQRLWAVLAALRRHVSRDEIAARSGMDPFFLHKFERIVAMERRLLGERLTSDLLWEAKRLGFSDAQIGTLADELPEQVRERRREWGLRPVYKMVDTCAAEFEAATPYFYSSYEQENEALPLDGKKAAILGSGPIRIGQGIEFDYCSVRAAAALESAGCQSILINSNPETVSTDFDASSRLYFEPLDAESVRDVLENESPTRDAADTPVVFQFGGQTAVNLADPLARAGVHLLGGGARSVDLAEDRRLFEDLVGRLAIPQPPGAAIVTVEQALKTAHAVGYPVLVRPSFVLGGWAMEIVHNDEDLIGYVSTASEIATGRPILVDKYLEGREVEVDAVCDGDEVLIPGIMEHVERAGVHSGDSIAIYPPLSLTEAQMGDIVEYTRRLGVGLGVKGLFNIQFVIHEGRVYVIEANPRSSRTIPFISKVTGVPMVDLATRVLLGQSIAEQGWQAGLHPASGLVAVKAPVFSMSKLPQVDTYLGPEMKSTGEVMGIDWDVDGAMAKALIAAGTMIPKQAPVLLSLADRDKPDAVGMIRALAGAGHPLLATEGTARMIEGLGLTVRQITKRLSEGHPNVVDAIEGGWVGAVVNTVSGRRGPLKDGFKIRRAAVERRIPCFTSLDTARVAVDVVTRSSGHLEARPLAEYVAGRPTLAETSVVGPAVR